MKKKIITSMLFILCFVSISTALADDSIFDIRSIRKDLIFSRNELLLEKTNDFPRMTSGGAEMLNMKCIPAAVAPASCLRCADIDVMFTIKNISQETWNPDEIRFVFTDGKEYLKYSQNDIFTVKEEVPYSEKAMAIFDVKAPCKIGNYLLTAEIYRNDEYLGEISNVLCVW